MLCVLALGCEREPSELELREIADGEWHVLHAADDGAILRRAHAGVRRSRPRGPIDPQPFAELHDTLLRSLDAETVTVSASGTRVELLRVDGGRLYVSQAGQQLIRSPANPRWYVLEEPHGLWLFKAPRSLTKLTTDEGLDSLLARQQEGRVILYWSASPVWSGDGKYISFLTNRKAVRTGTVGQGVWVVQANNGEQRDLHSPDHASLHVDGVLDDEFVFSSSKTPGVLSLHPGTAEVSKLGDGYLMASEPRGRGILINEDGVLKLMRRRRPAAAAGATARDDVYANCAYFAIRPPCCRVRKRRQRALCTLRAGC